MVRGLERARELHDALQVAVDAKDLNVGLSKIRMSVCHTLRDRRSGSETTPHLHQG